MILMTQPRFTISWTKTHGSILLLPLTFTSSTNPTDTVWIKCAFIWIRILYKNAIICSTSKTLITVRIGKAIFTCQCVFVTQPSVTAKIIAITLGTCCFLSFATETWAILIVGVTMSCSLESISIRCPRIITYARITNILLTIILCAHLGFALHAASARGVVGEFIRTKATACTCVAETVGWTPLTNRITITRAILRIGDDTAIGFYVSSLR
jgi:hypothetical protein